MKCKFQCPTNSFIRTQPTLFVLCIMYGSVSAIRTEESHCKRDPLAAKPNIFTIVI